jgi:hypothetical protein
MTGSDGVTNRHSPTYCNSYFTKGAAQVGFGYTRGQLYMYIEGSRSEIQSPTHWNVIGRNMTAPPHVWLPSSILPPAWCNCAFIPGRKISVRVNKCYYFSFLLCRNCVILKLRDLKLRKLGMVRMQREDGTNEDSMLISASPNKLFVLTTVKTWQYPKMIWANVAYV